jgi:hypothetical protein
MHSITYHFLMLRCNFPDRKHEAVPILSNDLSLEMESVSESSLSFFFGTTVNLVIIIVLLLG